MTEPISTDPKPVENQPNEPGFDSFDQFVTFVKDELAAIKKDLKPDKKTRQNKDDLRLYHEQMEGRISELHERLDGVAGAVETVQEKLQHGGNRTTFDRIWDFLFKP